MEDRGWRVSRLRVPNMEVRARLPEHRLTSLPTTRRNSSIFNSHFLAFKMAGKEATVFLLDLGVSMGEKRHGREQTDLEWAMEYVWDKITTTVSAIRYGC